ncbi:MAG: PP2C family protein-serine/threonine phosphatase [Vicinamibacteraceae bacterium]
MPDLPARISEWLLHLVTSQRAVAHLVVDGHQTLVNAGGDLAHYGLTSLQHRQRACDQLPFLVGLLPLPETPLLIRSMEMPSGRVADVHLLGDRDATWVVLLDVTMEHDEARKIQQKAYDMTLLSQREARLIAKLEAAHAELTAAHRELAESREELLRTHNRLRQELHDAERYVRAILPAPIVEPFAVDWRYVPCTELGGDSLGYHWIDSEHFALYLLDVRGHGVGAALLSVAVADTLRSGALRDTDFRLPEEVLESLNQIYQMEQQNELYFTIWYGVYHHPTGRLRYASAGHPAPILVSGPNGARGAANQLPAQGLPLGMLPNARYQAEKYTLVSPSRLFLFSDGVYEISRPDGSMLELAAFEDALARAAFDGRSELDDLLHFAWEVRGSKALEDDFSIIRMKI